MEHKDYLEKTSDIVFFLQRILNTELGIKAIVAQAHHDNKTLIEMLEAVKGGCDEWISELEAMEE